MLCCWSVLRVENNSRKHTPAPFRAFVLEQIRELMSLFHTHKQTKECIVVQHTHTQTRSVRADTVVRLSETQQYYERNFPETKEKSLKTK